MHLESLGGRYFVGPDRIIHIHQDSFEDRGRDV
jgi:hypothetical protein